MTTDGGASAWTRSIHVWNGSTGSLMPKAASSRMKIVHRIPSLSANGLSYPPGRFVSDSSDVRFAAIVA